VLFETGEWPRKLINYLLGVLKNYFIEVEEAMFQGVDRPCELIFTSWASKKPI
jgi:hypothetical protein